MLDLVDARDDRALLWVKDEDTAALSADQKARCAEHWSLTVADSAPVGAGRGGQDHLDARPRRGRAPSRGAPVLVLAPTGKAVDVAVREGAGDEGFTIAKALQLLRNNRLELRSSHFGHRR